MDNIIALKAALSSGAFLHLLWFNVTSHSINKAAKFAGGIEINNQQKTKDVFRLEKSAGPEQVLNVAFGLYSDWSELDISVMNQSLNTKAQG